MRRPLTVVLAAAMFYVAGAGAPAPAQGFLPGAPTGPADRKPNEVMVIGTAHLARLPDTFEPAAIQVLNDRLRGWRPDIIAIEQRSGPQCAFMRQYPDRYQATLPTYCAWDPAPARAALGLDVPAASAEIRRLLGAWPSSPTPSQRRRLAAVFLAGGEPISALVQWLRLAPADRHPGDGLDVVLAASLDKLGGGRGEEVLIAASLAAGLGLERVVGMDDHTADTPESEQDDYGAAIARAWDNPAAAQRSRMEQDLHARLGDGEGVLALYRALNDPSMARLVYDSDFGAALEERSAAQFGRSYVTWWETRNLRMAANIRETVANQPGKRVLVIVGASHKWYLEAYLGQMRDMLVVSSDRVLR